MMANRKIPAACAVASLVIGLLVVVGWAFDIGVLKSVLYGQITMKANTAVAFVITAITMLTICFRAKPKKLVAFVLGVAVMTVCILTLMEYLSGADFGIDELFVRDVGSLASSRAGWPP